IAARSRLEPEAPAPVPPGVQAEHKLVWWRGGAPSPHEKAPTSLPTADRSSALTPPRARARTRDTSVRAPSPVPATGAVFQRESQRASLPQPRTPRAPVRLSPDRKSTRLNSSHLGISYA